MHIYITLKDGTEYSLQIFDLKECGIYQKTFFIANKKERVEFPIESLSSFRVESTKGRLWEGDSAILNPATIILSQFLP